MKLIYIKKRPTFADPANTSIMLNENGKGYDEKMRD